MNQYNVLVFPCGTEIANEIINSLKYNKYFKIKLASSESQSYCNYRNLDISFLPYVTDDSFYNDLTSLIKQESIDFIIPAHDDVAYALSQIEDKIHAKVIGQNAYINDIVRFKDKTYDFFKGILPIAKTYNDESEIEFPIFVKPKRGQGSQNSFLIQNQSEFEHFKNSYDSSEFVWMEYLTGTEYTIDCFSDNGKLLYSGGRTRDKMTRGISVQSSLVCDKDLNDQFANYAKIISETLSMNGLWFYQLKYGKDGNLKLLEIGPRVSGTMMLNRAKGINFVELALYQKLGFDVEVIVNDIDVSLARALVPKYKTDIEYAHLYVDFDDTLFLEERYINTDLIKLIFQAKNDGKKVYLITKNKKNNLTKALHQFGISHVFDDVLHIDDNDKKVNYMKPNSLLVDDSFQERKEAIEIGLYAFGNDNLNVLIQ
jgi:carbamoylphosphate synthase large subunit